MSNRRQLHFNFFLRQVHALHAPVGGVSWDKKGRGAHNVELSVPSTPGRRGPFLSVDFPTVIILNQWISNG